MGNSKTKKSDIEPCSPSCKGKGGYRRGKNPKSLAALTANRIRPGEVRNPRGPGRAKIQLWRYICLYLELTQGQFDKLKTKNLTMSQMAALKIVEQLAEGRWDIAKDVIDRSEREQGGPDEILKIVVEYVG